MLTDPCSIVKELVDNAIDAKATRIEVSISPNLIDLIEVRDNGHGIAREDFEALGRRGHTSKIRTIEDLSSIAGSSLGFRGEALASATTLGTVLVTTRTEVEILASRIELKSSGGISAQSLIPHPVGTTVSVRNLFSKLPVRKQFSTKPNECSRQIKKITNTLKAYALARVSIGFCFRSMKTKSAPTKMLLSFSPRHNEGLKAAVTQVVGHVLASQCQQVCKLQPDATLVDTNKMGQEQYGFEAVLGKRDCQPGELSGAQFISVDSRPVTVLRRAVKKIPEIYKRHLSAALGGESIVAHPFLRLNIVCPPGSYDANVEPAKDDVIFADQVHFLAAVERFFEATYSAKNLDNDIVYRPATLAHGASLTLEIGSMTDNVSRHEVHTPVQQHGMSNPKPSQNEPTAASNPTNGIRVSDFSSDAMKVCAESNKTSPLQLVLGSREDPRSYGKSTGREKQATLIANPESARGNAHDVLRLDEVNERSTVRPAPLAHSTILEDTRDNSLYSRLLHDPATETYPPTPPSNTGPQEVISRHNDFCPRHSEGLSNQYMLHTWIRGLNENVEGQELPRTTSDSGTTDEEMLLEQTALPEAALRFSPATNLIGRPVRTDGNTTLTPPQSMKRPGFTKVSQKANKPFVPPARKQRATIIQDSQQPQRLTSAQSISQSAQHTAGMGSVSENIVAYMVPRSTHISKNKNQDMDLSEYGAQMSRSNCSSAIKPLQPLLPDDDPRTYFMRRKRSKNRMAAPGCRLARSKTIMLPFESIPDTLRLHNLEHSLQVNVATLALSTLDHLKASSSGPDHDIVHSVEEQNAFIIELEHKIRYVFEKWCSLNPQEESITMKYGSERQLAVADLLKC